MNEQEIEDAVVAIMTAQRWDVSRNEAGEVVWLSEGNLALACFKAGMQASNYLPPDVQPVLLLSQANIALRKALKQLEDLLPLCIKRMDGDELQAYWDTYHDAGRVATRLKPIILAADAEAEKRLAAPIQP